MWGPPDAVRYAVRANAERMGIDPTKISGFYPLWEGVGPKTRNYADFYNSSAYTEEPLVVGGKLDALGYSGVASGYININSYSGELLELSKEITILAAVTPSSIGSIDRDIVSRWGDSSLYYQFRFWLDVGDGATGYAAAIYNGSTTFKAGITTQTAASNKSANIAFSYKERDFLTVFVDGKKIDSAATLAGVHSTSMIYGVGIGSAGANVMSGTTGFLGIIHQVVIFDRKLDNELVKSLTTTPYALLMPVSRPVYFDLGVTYNPYLTVSINQTLSLSDTIAKINREASLSANQLITTSSPILTTQRELSVNITGQITPP